MTLATTPSHTTHAARATTRIALLGCGGIGAALAVALAEHDSYELTGALVRSVEARKRPLGVGCLTDSFEAILASKPDVVVECLGGVEPAASWCERLLERGVHVVSANKLMVADSLDRLSRAAQRGNAQIRFDAAVCAGVPVLDAVARLRSAGITSIRGVVNGTTQWILDEVTARKVTVEAALHEAIRLGYAEPDPSADLSGRDSADKLSLLAAAAGFGLVPVSSVATAGLVDGERSLEREDILDFQRWGALRLVAHATRTDVDSPLCLSVSPTLVARNDALARVTGTENVVELHTTRAGRITLRGPGAGAQPTVAALLADIDACVGGGRSWASGPHHAATLDADPLAPQRWALRVSSDKGESAASAARAAEKHALHLEAVHSNAQRVLLAVSGSSLEVHKLRASLEAAAARVRVVRLDAGIKIVE